MTGKPGAINMINMTNNDELCSTAMILKAHLADFWLFGF